MHTNTPPPPHHHTRYQPKYGNKNCFKIFCWQSHVIKWVTVLVFQWNLFLICYFCELTHENVMLFLFFLTLFKCPSRVSWCLKFGNSSRHLSENQALCFVSGNDSFIFLWCRMLSAEEHTLSCWRILSGITFLVHVWHQREPVPQTGSTPMNFHRTHRRLSWLTPKHKIKQRLETLSVDF